MMKNHRTWTYAERKQMNEERWQRGFTLVEIMVVVAVIAIIAAIAIPNLMTARVTANEGAIKRDIRTFGSAAEAYRSAQGVPQYPPNIISMINATPPYLDSSWTEGGVKHGFTVNYQSYNVGQTYTLKATPFGNEARNTYCLDNTSVIIGGAAGVVAGAAGCSGGTPIS